MASRAFLSLLSNEQDCGLRYSLFLSATLTTTTDKMTVKLCEIGCTGAWIEGSNLPRIGRDVILACGQREIFGCIVAGRNGGCEIEFEERIDEGELLHWLHMSAEEARAVAEAFRRPAVRTSRLSPAEQKLADLWSDQGGASFS